MPESFEFISEILDKLIETQVQNANVTANLKNAVDDNNEHLKELKVLLAEVNSHFSNGFRQELKDSISDAAARIERNVDIKSEEGKHEAGKILKAVTDFTAALKSPKSWIGAFLLVTGVIGALVGVVTVVLKLMEGAAV